MASEQYTADVPLPWARQDIEQKLFFAGGRHTRVNNLLAALLGLLISVVFYCVLIFGLPGYAFTKMFTEQGKVPFAIVFFSAWSLAIIFLKWRKLALQKRALDYEIGTKGSDFVLSAGNVDQVIDEMYRIVDEPKNFVLYNRIVVALSNLKNLGRVGDVDEILKSQAENDEAASDSSYAVLGGFIWAIPVLGFIGTVLGLSAAIGEFGSVLESGADMEIIKEKLAEVTGGLSTAFVTTLQALVAALGIQLLQTFLRKSEQEFLDECGRYCTDRVVNKLRIMPFERVDREES